MTVKPSRRELEAELDALRARLAEAEEAVRAIRVGEVDAVMVTGEHGAQVYTLSGADRAYRQLIETMSEGAATLSANGVILYCNDRLAKMLGQPLDQVMGAALRNYLSPADQQAVGAMLKQARTAPSRREISLKTSEGRLLPVYLSASRLQSEGVEMAFGLVLTNLTEQKSHEQIVAAERLARLILEQVVEAIIVCNGQGQVIRASKAAERFCDGSPLLKSFAEMFPLRTDVHSPFHLAPVLRGETLRNVDVVLDVNGQAFDLILNAGPLLSGQEIVGCVVTLIDISERKRAENELRERERTLEDAQRFAHVGSWDRAVATGAITWSAELCRIYGLDPTHPIPGFDDLEQFYTPESWVRLRAAVENALRFGALIDLDVQIVRTDGTVIWVATRGEVVRDAAGQIVGTRGTIHDITGRKQAEEALARESHRSQTLLRNASDGIHILDADGNVLEVSDSFCTMLGYSREELIGANVSLWDAQWSAQELKQIVAKQIAKGVRTAFETQYRRRDGSVFDVEISGLPLELHGQPVLFNSARDITLRKRADEELAKTRDELERFFNLVPDMITVASPDGHLKRVNPQWERTLGYTREELLRMPYTSLIHPDDLLPTKREVETQLQGGTTANFQNRYRHKDGSYRWLDWTASAAVDGLLYAAARDVTERNLSEEARKHRDAELRESQRIARIGSWEWTIVTGAVAWSDGMNHVLARDLGAPSPTFAILPQFYTPESWQRLGAVIATAVETGASYDLELEMIRADGAIISTTTRGEAIRGADGTVVKLRGTVLDITEQKQAEAALRLQSAALNAAANAMTITSRDGTIEWINAAFTRLTGYSAEEAIGRNPRELVKSGVHDQAFYKAMWDTILAGDVWRGEMTNRRKDGSLYVEEQTVTPVKNDHGEVAHFIAIKRDLTEQRQLQSQFLQAQKMETVGRLAGGIAHDFNNLLTVINGTAEIASMDLSEDDPLRKELGEISRAGDRAATLTRQLLAFSRKQVMKFEVLDLGRLTADLKGMLQRMIGENIVLGVRGTQDLGNVMADPGQIEQVVMNLAVNARDAMPNGGALTIETRNVDIDEGFAVEHPSLRPVPHVMLAISDTGVGMDDATRARIFEPFFTTKAAGKGTGLGLATVYGIVKQTGGSIRVDSELGRGTSFKIYLPRIEAAVRKVEPAPAVASVQGTETILIVEDDEAVRQLALRVLELAGYSVLTASGGAEAIRVLERHGEPVHLVLTDMVMPGMSGSDLAMELEEISPRTKIIFASGYSDDSIPNQQLPHTASHFIAKPYTTTDLTRKVREVLDSQEG